MNAAATGSTTTADLHSIKVPDNVRDLDEEHVLALAQSIELQGLISPLTVRPCQEEGFTYELVAGFHRYAALMQLGVAVEVPITLRGEGDASVSDAADRATENILRKQLNPYEEAVAVQAMLDRGLTEDGAAQALGWSVQRVRARTRLLALPERVQQLVGAGTIPLSAVAQVEQIQAVEPKIVDAITKAIDEGHDYLGEELDDRPGSVLDAIMREDPELWFEWMSTVDKHDVERFKLGKRATEHMEAIEAADKEMRPYGGYVQVYFEDAEVDQARAAGVLIEFAGHGNRGIITDRKLYRELCKQALRRGAAEAAERLEQHRAHAKTSKRKDPDAPADPLRDAKRIHREKTNQLKDQAHGVNLELWHELITGLEVSADDMDVARFFVYGLLGPDARKDHWNDTGERVARLASQGIRIVVEDFRTDVTPTKRDGAKGRMKIDYGDREVDKYPEAAERWLWKFIEGAKTASELYGRALMVIAAERYALSRIVLPASQRHHPQHFGAHKDIAEKMLKRLTKDHVPASLTALKRAIDKADAELRRAEDDVRAERSAQSEPDPGYEQVGDINFPADQDEDLADDGE